MEKESAGGFFAMVKKINIKKDSHWLFAKNTEMCTKKQKNAYLLFNAFLVLTALAVLCVCSLYLARGPEYPVEIFYGYFNSASIMALNFVPILLLFLFLYALTGRGWIAYLADSILVMLCTVINYFVVKFRDDTFMFSDITLAREAWQISKEGYNYEITPDIVFCVAVPLVFTVILFAFQKYVPGLKMRLAAIAVVLVSVFSLKGVYFSKAVYDKKTDNLDHIIVWAPTQKFVSKGYVYPFLHSMKELFAAPDGYDERKSKEILLSYDSDKVDEKTPKVNVICVMLEAYCDLGTMNVDGIQPRAYEIYHKLKKENYSGTLVNNIFSAGTIDTERAFLTGYPGMNNFRSDADSYVRYLSSYGYTAVGSHPSEEWFYNRRNVNSYLGFSDYRFIENYFGEKYDASYMRNDAVVFDDIYNQYVETSDDGRNPYFGFHVTYQGHAPYPTDYRIWMTDEKPLYYNENVSSETENIVNNYLGSTNNTMQNVSGFIEKIKLRSEPVVVVLFGDHKPWLGDGSSAYQELGISLDQSTEEGFLNYYSTEYVIIANDSAKELLDDDFKGKGPTTSPCFLMNVVFDKLGIEGPGYMQYTDEIMKKLPVVNDVGAIDRDGNFYPIEEMPENIKNVYDELYGVAYYKYTHYDE